MRPAALSHALLRNRVFLGYPLDILLNRDCLLRDYDRGVLKCLHEYDESAARLLEGESPDALAQLSELLDAASSREGFIGALEPPFAKMHDEYSAKLVGGDDLPKHGKIGSLVLPSRQGPGTGNILIRGRPGTAKSMLALQLVVASAVYPNFYSSVFFSLEEQVGATLRRSNRFGWDKYIRPVRFLDRLDDSSGPEEIAAALHRLLTQPVDHCRVLNEGEAENCPGTQGHCQNQKVEPSVLMPILSPRSFAARESPKQSLFWERFRQLETLLVGAKSLRDHDQQIPPSPHEALGHDLPHIRVVCIDSLTAFGDEPLTRQELHQIFDLFRRNEVIGIFTAEESSDPADEDMASVMEYLADVVIRLRAEEDNGYALRYFEIRKSRHQHEIYGRHPMRLGPPERYADRR